VSGQPSEPQSERQGPPQGEPRSDPLSRPQAGERALGRATLLEIGLRANLLQAAWNFERQQGLGWAFALAPALRQLYPSREDRLSRLAEHTAYFNTQPTLASIALGAAARIEEDRARGAGGDAASMARLKAALGSALAALGDRLFWFSLRPFAAAIGVLVAMVHPSHGWGAWALWLVYALPHLTMRFGGVGWGYSAGPAVLSGWLAWHCENGFALAAGGLCRDGRHAGRVRERPGGEGAVGVQSRDHVQAFAGAAGWPAGRCRQSSRKTWPRAARCS